MIAFAEFFELRSDIEDICFYIGRGAYFHPFLQSRYIGGIYFKFLSYWQIDLKDKRL